MMMIMMMIVMMTVVMMMMMMINLRLFVSMPAPTRFPLSYASACATGSGLSGTTGLTKHLTARLWPEGLDRPMTLVGLHLLAVPDATDRCAKREAQVKPVGGGECGGKCGARGGGGSQSARGPRVCGCG